METIRIHQYILFIKKNLIFRSSLLSKLSDDQLHVLAGLAREEYWTFRTEIDSSQLVGHIYVITQGRVYKLAFLINF